MNPIVETTSGIILFARHAAPRLRGIQDRRMEGACTDGQHVGLTTHVKVRAPISIVPLFCGIVLASTGVEDKIYFGNCIPTPSSCDSE